MISFIVQFLTFYHISLNQAFYEHFKSTKINISNRACNRNS